MNKIYTETQLKEQGLIFFKGDSLATNVWISKYALKDKDGNYRELSPEDTVIRITKEIYRAESAHPNPLTYEEIYEVLKDFKYFIFGGSILYGLGNPYSVSSLGNCFFIHNGADSYGGIFNTEESMVQLMKRRGGVGITLEHLRPEHSSVNNAAKTSTGAISFMNRFSNGTREVAQDGRRGALMITIDIRHPNSDKFIIAKDNTSNITGANISLKISDKFMQCVKDNKDFYQIWPIQETDVEINEELEYNKIHVLENGLHVKRIKAKELWNLIIKQAHKNAEPGVLFWDKMTSDGPQDFYSKDGFTTIGLNPCITGETLVSVADGRGEVRMDKLVKEGKDIPVYCLNNEGKLDIQLMRNPRITGYNKEIYKITLDSGDIIRVTGNHKIRLHDGKYVEAKDLKYGDSLHIGTYNYSPIVYKKNKHNKKNYRFIKTNNLYGKGKSEHRLIYEFHNNIEISTGYVIHHKDYNTLNNSISNLECLSIEEHNYLHLKNMLGKKNPYFKMTDEWKYNFASHPGESNSHYSGILNIKLYKEILKKTKELNRRISTDEWTIYAKEKGLPQILNSKFRGNTSTYLLTRAANFLKLEYVDKDPRIVRTYFKALANGYESKIVDSIVKVKKTCEECGKELWINYENREKTFCSSTCSNLYVNRNTDTNIRRTNTINATYNQKANIIKENQVKIYSQLKFNLKKEPFFKEWCVECKNQKVPYRLNSKHSFKTYADLKVAAETYNHKVVSVELDGIDTVYNGTVDKYHNFYTVLKPFDKVTQSKQFIINQLNCGEVGLSPFDSCRLGSLNLFSLVDEPFTVNAKFNWGKLERISKIAQRFMDDIIDLEEVKINNIIEKIKSDKEPEHVKRVELETWLNVLEVLKKGRRTGIGVLGLSDTMAALGIQYGTEEATKFGEKINKTIAVNCYRESVNLAKERGCFPIWSTIKEAESPFIIRIINSFTEAEQEDYLKYGRRNIASLSIAPTGCISENTLIQTNRGNISIKDIFLLNNINIEKFRGLNKIWIEPEIDLFVIDVNENKQKINKLYWNGKSNGYNFKFSDNFNVNTSTEHKFLVYINKNKAIWKKASEIKIGDKIVKTKLH